MDERDTLINRLPVGIYTLIDSSGPLRIERVTDRALELLGVSRSMVESDAMSALTHIHPDDRQQALTLNQEARSTKRKFVVEARFLVDSRQRWLRIESWPSSSSKGVRWSGYIADTTDQHEAESMFKHLYDHSPLAISLHDPETGQILEGNRASWKLFGLDSARALRNFLFRSDSPHSIADALEKVHAAASGELQRFQWRAATVDGRTIWLLVTLIPIEIGGLRRVLATSTDISEMIAAQQRFAAIFQRSPIAVFVQDARTGELLDANDQAAAIYGYESVDALVADPSALALGGEYSQEQALIRIQRAVAEGGDRFFWRSRHSSGRELWMDVSLTPVELDGRGCVLAACADITEQRLAAQRLEESEERFRRVLQDIDGVAVQGYRLDGRVSYWNRASELLYDYSEEEARRSTLFDLIIPEGIREEVRTDVAAVARGGGIPNGELELMRKDGSLVPVYSSHTVLRSPDKEPELFCIDIDLSERKAHEAALDKMANYDSLTGLPNRRLMAGLIDQMMARAQRNKTSFVLCYLDLDDFKPINDRFGHDIGDEVLIAIAHRLRRLLRRSDMVARMGGDEFVVALDGIDEGHELDRRMRSLLDGVARPILIDRWELQVCASIGVTVYPNDPGDPDTLLRHADQAMYRAKTQGRNRYSLFDVALETSARHRRERLAAIESGLQAGEFRLHYQPKIELGTGQLAGLESLVRWHRSPGIVLPPMEFLPELGGSDLERRFGVAMIEQAIRQVSNWSSDGLDIAVSVNISGTHLLSEGFVEALEGLLNACPGCPPNRLCIEIIESAAVDDLRGAIQVLEKIRGLDVQISLDDFGTGYSSLSHLRSLPVDEVKIDQSFVHGMLDDHNNRNIVQSVISLADAFNLRVVAEGVETEAQRQALSELGCELGQGFVFARPMPADEVAAWIRARSKAGT